MKIIKRNFLKILVLILVVALLPITPVFAEKDISSKVDSNEITHLETSSSNNFEIKDAPDNNSNLFSDNELLPLNEFKEKNNLVEKSTDYNAQPVLNSTKTAGLGNEIKNTLSGISFRKTDNINFGAKPTKYGYSIVGPARTVDGKTLNAITDLQEIKVESALIKDKYGNYVDTKVAVVLTCNSQASNNNEFKKEIIDFKVYDKNGTNKSPLIISKDMINNKLSDMKMTLDDIWSYDVYYIQNDAPNAEKPWVNSMREWEINELDAGNIVWTSKVENNKPIYKSTDYFVRNFVQCIVGANNFFDPGFNQLIQSFTYLSTSNIEVAFDKTKDIQPNEIIEGTFEISNISTYHNSALYFGFSTEPSSQFEILIDETASIPEEEGFYQPTKESWKMKDECIIGALAKKTNKFNWYSLPGGQSIKVKFKVKVNENYDGDEIKIYPFIYTNGNYSDKNNGNQVTIEGHKFLVKFDTNGGYPEISMQEVKKGTKLNIPQISKKGFILDGWYTEKEFINKWDFKTDVVLSDITLYAKWIPKPEIINNVPIILAKDKTLSIGDMFDPLKDIAATDLEDGDITQNINIIENTVDTSKEGIYTVKYEVSDSKGAKVTKTIKVTVEKAKVTIHNKYINGYPDKTFRQENSITRGELSAMLARIILDGKPTPITENKFSDISNDYWGKDEVNYLASKGILIGYEDGTFRPENPITRAEIATMIVRANTNIKKKVKSVFPDVNDGYWAKKYIDKATELGYMMGYEDGTFRPENHTTRAETAVTLNRIYRNACDFKEINSSKIPFTDLNKNNWAYNDIIKATITHEHI